MFSFTVRLPDLTKENLEFHENSALITRPQNWEKNVKIHIKVNHSKWNYFLTIRLFMGYKNKYF